MIQHGHSLRDVEQYTLAQARCFLQAIDKAEAVRDLMLLRIALAPHCEKKAVKELFSEIGKRVSGK